MTDNYCTYCKKNDHSDEECWCTRAAYPLYFERDYYQKQNEELLLKLQEDLDKLMTEINSSQGLREKYEDYME